MAELILSLGAFWTLAMVLLAVLWIALPFAVFGIKDRLDKQTQIMSKILRELEAANGKHVDKQKPIPAAQEASYPSEPTHFERVPERENSDRDNQVKAPDLYADPFAIKFGKKKDQ